MNEILGHIHDLEDMIRDLHRDMDCEERVQIAVDALEKTHQIQRYLAAAALAAVKRRDGELC